MPIQKGSAVVLVGLQETKLNGVQGIVVKHCSDSKRWAVQIGERCIAVKAQNLVVAKELQRSKMCRYGERCWRPDCHFSHPCEESRANKWANHWQSVCKASASDSEADDMYDSSEEPCAPKVLSGVRSNFEMADAEFNVSQRMLELEVRMASVLEDLDKVKCPTYLSSSTSPDSILPPKQDQVFTVEPRFVELDARIASLDEKLGRELDDRMLGMLRAAVTPMAELVAEKLVSVEARVNALWDNSGDNVEDKVNENKIADDDVHDTCGHATSELLPRESIVSFG